VKTSLLLSVATAGLLLGCAAPRPVWIKPGVSKEDRNSVLSKCEYQVRLQKTPQADMQSLMKLCMQGEGYRLTRQ
jgi:hypothetical protein